jgi:hypothetical protein
LGHQESEKTAGSDQEAAVEFRETFFGSADFSPPHIGPLSLSIHLGVVSPPVGIQRSRVGTPDAWNNDPISNHAPQS